MITGGDPLILSPRRLTTVAGRLGAIAHVKIVRWHTRVPVVAPELVDDALVAALQAPGKATWLVVHTNHPREFTSEACAALARLADAGIPLLSQSVLLRGVNDHPATLEALMRACVRTGEALLPHHVTWLRTAHFARARRGQVLMREIRAASPACPRPTCSTTRRHGKCRYPPILGAAAPMSHRLLGCGARLPASPRVSFRTVKPALTGSPCAVRSHA